jgi:hypothetical protein
MHGLIFETSVCYWQDQPDFYSWAGRPHPTTGVRPTSRATIIPTRGRVCLREKEVELHGSRGQGTDKPGQHAHARADYRFRTSAPLPMSLFGSFPRRPRDKAAGGDLRPWMPFPDSSPSGRKVGWWAAASWNALPNTQAFAIRVTGFARLPNGYQYGPFTQRLRGEGTRGASPGKAST